MKATREQEMSTLTEERIKELWSGENNTRPILGVNKVLAFARAIEAECRGVPDYVWMIGTKGFMALFATEEAANDWQQMNGTNTPASYIQPVSIPVISAAPKPDPERKHEIVPTLAEPSEYAKAFQDMITHGCSFMKDGMRIPPEDVIEPAEPDCECGAVASEHCPACEPVAQEQDEFDDRYKVVRTGFWWRVRIGDGQQTVGRCYTETEAQRLAAALLTAFRDGQFVSSPPVAQEPITVEALREIETAWIADALSASIANIGYPVGCGVAPNREGLMFCAGKLFDRFVALAAAIHTQPDQSAEVPMTPAASIFKDEVARLNAEVERLRGNLHAMKQNALRDVERIAELEAEVERLREYHEGYKEEVMDTIEELRRQQAVLVEALEKLARLGNGEHYGNSEGNCIAIAALASVKGNAELKGGA